MAENGNVRRPAGEKIPVPLLGRRHNSDLEAESPWARKVILSLDGGGVRGYASLLILEDIMTRIKHIEKNYKDTPASSSSAYTWAQDEGHIPDCWQGQYLPHHYIDYFVGTSTGGLSALMLGRLQMSVQESCDRYNDVGKQVFGRLRITDPKGIFRTRYKARYMNRVLQAASQQDVVQRVHPPLDRRAMELGGSHEQIRHRADNVLMRSHHSDSARTLVVAYGGYTVKRPYVFRSYEHKVPSQRGDLRGRHLNPGAASDFTPVWMVGRATSAAPTYFSPITIGNKEFKDGAMARCNNPTQLGYNEVKQMHWNHEPAIIVSIGTGIKPAQGNSKKWWQQGNVYDVMEDRKTLQTNVLDSDAQHIDFAGKVDIINKDLHPDDIARLIYYRFDVPQGLGGIKLGEWKGKNGASTKDKMREAVKAYLGTQDEYLSKLASRLVDIRRRRAETERWEHFALHVIYCCKAGNCGAPPCESRFKARRHASRVHGEAWHIQSSKEGSPSNVWTCSWKDCRALEFVTKADFHQHLLQVHNTRDPQAKIEYTLERWLDKCREVREPPNQSRQQTGLSRPDTFVNPS